MKVHNLIIASALMAILVTSCGTKKIDYKPQVPEDTAIVLYQREPSEFAKMASLELFRASKAFLEEVAKHKIEDFDINTALLSCTPEQFMERTESNIAEWVLFTISNLQKRDSDPDSEDKDLDSDKYILVSVAAKLTKTINLEDCVNEALNSIGEEMKKSLAEEDYEIFLQEIKDNYSIEKFEHKGRVAYKVNINNCNEFYEIFGGTPIVTISADGQMLFMATGEEFLDKIETLYTQEALKVPNPRNDVIDMPETAFGRVAVVDIQKILDNICSEEDLDEEQKEFVSARLDYIADPVSTDFGIEAVVNFTDSDIPATYATEANSAIAFAKVGAQMFLGQAGADVQQLCQYVLNKVNVSSKDNALIGSFVCTINDLKKISNERIANLAKSIIDIAKESGDIECYSADDDDNIEE